MLSYGISMILFKTSKKIPQDWPGWIIPPIQSTNIFISSQCITGDLWKCSVCLFSFLCYPDSPGSTEKKGVMRWSCQWCCTPKLPESIPEIPCISINRWSYSKHLHSQQKEGVQSNGYHWEESRLEGEPLKCYYCRSS